MQAEILISLLTGASAAAVIKLIDNLIQWRLNRKAAKEDKTTADSDRQKQLEEERRQITEQKIDALTGGLQIILLDRIQNLGQSYLHDQEVDFDARRRLNDMHSVYHNKLGGNGDLDVLMNEVNSLPLTKH